MTETDNGQVDEVYNDAPTERLNYKKIINNNNIYQLISSHLITVFRSIGWPMKWLKIRLWQRRSFISSSMQITTESSPLTNYWPNPMRQVETRKIHRPDRHRHLIRPTITKHSDYIASNKKKQSTVPPFVIHFSLI